MFCFAVEGCPKGMAHSKRKVKQKIEIVSENLKSPTHSLLRKLYSNLS